MSENQKTLNIPLPKAWKKHVRSAVLHVISLAQYTTISTRGWAADSSNQRVRLRVDLDRAMALWDSTGASLSWNASS